MTSHEFNDTARTEALTSSSALLPGGVSPASQPLSSASVESIMAMLHKLEARLDDRDGRGGAIQTIPRPDPDPPYGMPRSWQPSSWVPGGTAAARVEPTYSMPPTIQFPSSTSGFGDITRSTLGFRQPPAITRHVPPQQSSSWDAAPSRSVWELQPHRFTSAASVPDPTRLIKMDPPVFDGSDVHSWINRIQYYFDHIMLPDEQRLHYVVMLFASPATNWIFSYRANNPVVTWSQFLEDVRRRFDPNYFVNYIELIAKLTQTGSVVDYNKEFNRMMDQIHGVAESTLLPIYLGGLRNPIKTLVRFQHPASVAAAAMAIATEFETSADRGSTAVRRPWQGRDSRTSSGSVPSTATTNQSQAARTSAPISRPRDYSKLPVIRLTAAEKAEKSRLGLCWYCSEKWATGHVCKGPFLAYIGPDDDDEEVPLQQARDAITLGRTSSSYGHSGF